jgi:hypothetical protein
VSQSGSNATTTAGVLQTFYGTARGNATISSYSSVFTINVTCGNANAIVARLNDELSALEVNGSVNTFNPVGSGQISVDAGKESAYQLFLKLWNAIGNSTACTSFTSSVNINLPGRMIFHLPPQPGLTGGQSLYITIPASLQSGSLPITLMRNATSEIPVFVDASIAVNGSIYGGIRVAQA